MTLIFGQVSTRPGSQTISHVTKKLICCFVAVTHNDEPVNVVTDAKEYGHKGQACNDRCTKL
jgi:hypothetical protein